MTRLRDKNWLFPTLLWAGFLVFAVAWLSLGQRKFHSLHRALFQWDGQHYLSIARDGYQLYPCEFNTNWLCGNVGWFPFYPILGKIVGALTFTDMRWVMTAVDWLAFLGALILLGRLVKRHYGDKVSRSTLVALVAFPSAFYFFAGFPYATYLFLATIIFTLIDNEKYWWAVLPSACLAITYPSGLTIGLPLAWILLTNWRKLKSSQRLALASAILSLGLALFLYAGYYWLKFDDFFLYQRFQAQSFYAHQTAFPLITLYKSLTTLRPASPEFISIVFVIITVALFYDRRIPAAWQLYALSIILFTPTFGTTTSYYRQVIVAFPIFAMVGLAIESRWRRYLLGIYVLAGIGLMLTVFFAGFKQGTLM